MAHRKSLCLFIALAVLKLTAAESSGEEQYEPTQEEMQRAPLFGLGSMPFFMGFNPSGSGSGSGGLPDFSSMFSGLMPGMGGSGSGGMPNPLSFFGSMLGGGSRDKRSARDGEHGHGHGHGPEHEHHEQEPTGEQGPQERLFFRHPTPVACNFTTQAGSSCLSCTQALRCRSNNVGSLRTCRGLFPYCNNGRCSLFPGAQCFSSTTASGAGSATQPSETTTVAAETTTDETGQA